MKTILTVVFLSVCTLAFSQRVALTADEKEILEESTRFRNHVKWSLLAQADFWINSDQTGTATQVNRVRWAKSRLFAKQIVTTGVEPTDYTNTYLHFLKNVQVRLQAGEFNLDETINHMVSAGVFESLADQTFDFKIATIQF